MRRTAVALALVVLLGAAPAAAQEWARKMFEGTSHDFAGVARGSKVEHRFVLTNLYEEDVHISGVRSSCGCTSAEFSKDTLKTYETGEIVCTFNTRAFTGQRSATVTVTLDQPFFAEVQLQVSGYIRTDVVLHPAGVEFGTVDHGSTAERRIEIDYAGRSDWRITGIKSASPYIQAEFVETDRKAGNVSYELVVHLKDAAPVGYLKEQLVLSTNDRRETELPVDIDGQVVASVTISPASLFLGVLETGQKVTKQLVVRAKQPFRIVAIHCDDDRFTFKTSDDAKPLHMIPVTFVASGRPGKIVEKIRIETDLGDGASPECAAYAQVSRPAVKQAAQTTATDVSRTGTP